MVDNINTLCQSQFRPKRPWHTGELEVYLYSFFNVGARWEWVANSTIRLLYLQQKARGPILQKAGWSSRLVRKVTENYADTGARKSEPTSLQQVAITTEQSRPPQ